MNRKEKNNAQLPLNQTIILHTQNDTMNRRAKNYGHLPQCDCNITMMINFVYTNKTMNKKGKNSWAPTTA
jgi:hypothetical protein